MSDATARIMMVEDDETIALGVQTALKMAGSEVRHYDRAELALDDLRDWKPHLVILDRMLPGIDGLSALTYIREQSEAIQVIMLTAKGSEADRVEGLDAGADDYVAKPFSPKVLLARVRAGFGLCPRVPAPRTSSALATSRLTCAGGCSTATEKRFG